MLTLKRIRVKKLTVNLYNGTNCYNAGSKAIADFLKILSSKGYRILSFRIPIGKSKAAKLYLLIRDVLKGYCTIHPLLIARQEWYMSIPTFFSTIFYFLCWH